MDIYRALMGEWENVVVSLTKDDGYLILDGDRYELEMPVSAVAVGLDEVRVYHPDRRKE